MIRTDSTETGFRLVIGVGFQKTGTTSIHKFLLANGLVNPGKKEISAFRPRRTLQPVEKSQYLKMLRVKNPESIYGEFSPNYLSEPTSIWNLSKVAPAAKLIVSVRNPVDRAYSAYVHGVGSGRINEEKSFGECIDTALQGSPNWWENSLLSFGFYAKPIYRMLQMFPRESVMFANYDTWTQNSAINSFEDSLIAFSGLSRNPESSIKRINEQRYWASKKAPLSDSIQPETKALLQGYFNESKNSLEDLLQLELGWW